MPRNIVICCDGTSNTFGTTNTNVVRTVQVLADDPTGSQLVYYDPGIGTLPEPGWATRVGQKLSQAMDLAFATGLPGKVQRAYAYLMNVWEPGDDVFLFGFSRGAYTVRVLGGMLHAIGLLPRRSDNLVPYAWRLFGAIRGGDEGGDGAPNKYWPLLNEFRATFARPLPDTADRRFPLRFVGVWDTVSSVGWVWEPAKYPYTARNPSIRTIRHAVALDERRCFFRQNLFRSADGQDLEELWFPGTHSDVGGGRPEQDGALWRSAFEWVVTEAERAGLRIDHERLDRMLARGASRRAWEEPVNESLVGPWRIAEYFPKMTYSTKRRRSIPTLGRGRPRKLRGGEMLHPSVLDRLCNGRYDPRCLPAASRKGLPCPAPSVPHRYEPVSAGDG